MSPQTEQDLVEIFSNINLPLKRRIIDHLRVFENSNLEILTPINTRNDKGQPLGYFDNFHRTILKTNAFIAGGVQNSLSNIRFVEHNIALRLVEGFTFPYQQPLKIKQVCVELREETVDILPILFWCQLQWFANNGSHN